LGGIFFETQCRCRREWYMYMHCASKTTKFYLLNNSVKNSPFY